jgi:UDP-N-acetyl-D-galactosamine dehydrogenase
VNELNSYGAEVDVYDPEVSSEEVFREYGIDTISTPKNRTYDAIILAVGHKNFSTYNIAEIRAFGKDNFIFYDLKYVFKKAESDLRL